LHEEALQDPADDALAYRTHARAQQEAALYGARYEAPQFGRKRCNDIGITGPAMRAGSARGGALAARAGYSMGTSTTATNIFATHTQF